MIARLLRLCALAIGFYVMLTGVHYGTLWALDQLRQRWEVRLEAQYGTEAVDREPPYKPGERLMMALDIQPSLDWREAVGVSALLSLPAAILMGLAVWVIRRARRLALLIVAGASNILLLWLLTQLGGLALVGYLVNNPVAVVVEGAIVGILQGILAMLILTPKRG
jgi:hypothetical protein